jgi:hypothetical protein
MKHFPQLAFLSSFATALLTFGACGGDANPGTADISAPDDTAITDDVPAADTATPDTAPACPQGTACDDGNACTEDDQCDAAGVCAGSVRTCDDGLTCTTDACVDGACQNTLIANFCIAGEANVCVAVGAADPTNGCRVCVAAAGGGTTFEKRVDGFSCNDGNACTTADTCADGLCVGGAALVCNSNDPCIARTCDPNAGCVASPTTETCDDGDPCTVGDTCANGLCSAGTGALSCDDQDPCTADSCRAGVGCEHSFACDDNDPCTNDSCDATTGACTHDAFVGPCDDGNPCTENEACNADGQCIDGTPVDCNDGNTCTIDVCDPERGGCLGLFVTAECDEQSCQPAPCDDGEWCTANDQCVAGQCFGGKTRDCDSCVVTPTDRANKIIRLEISADGYSGSGLDLDNDPNTCAPVDDCGGGVDNAMAPLAAILGNNVQASVDDGVVMWLVDLSAWDGTTNPFMMPVYDSGLADANAFCDFQGGPRAPEQVDEVCMYEVAQLSFDASCEPYFAFANARVVPPKISAGGPDTLIRMVLPLASGSLLGLTIAAARFEGSVSFDLNGNIASVNGILGGAIPKVQLVQAVLELRPEDIGGLDPSVVVPVIDAFVSNDIDLDGDGLDDAASVAIRITTIPARIVE